MSTKDAAVEHFEHYLSEHPKDLETMFSRVVTYAQKQEIDKAISNFKKAVDKGLPFARLVLPAGR